VQTVRGIFAPRPGPGILAIALMLASPAGGRLPMSDERDAAKITICGPVEHAEWASSTEGRPTHVDMGDARSGARVRVVIPFAARDAFVAALGDTPEKVFRGKSICATGVLSDRWWWRKSRLEVTSPADVSINQ
jgi:hypothetical protein